MKQILAAAALAAMLGGCGPVGAGLGAFNISSRVAGDEIRAESRATDKSDPHYVGSPEYFGPNDTIDRSVPSGKRPRDTP